MNDLPAKLSNHESLDADEIQATIGRLTNRIRERFPDSSLSTVCRHLLDIAALYIQQFDDSVAISSVNEVETLCTGLSRKIWQKIMILDQDDC